MAGLPPGLPTTFTTQTARRRGIHPRDLYAWRDGGLLLELSRGIFRRADGPPASWPDLLAVAYRFPRAVVFGLSAAVVHDLTDDLPPAVQIAVSADVHPPRIAYPPTTVFRLAPSIFSIGVERLEAAPGEFTQVYDPARTVVDLMRMRARLGEPTAHAALWRYLRRSDAKPARLLDYAETLNVFGPMRLALDVARAG